MTLQHLTVECASALSLRHTVTSHGWVNLAPWRWDDERGQLSRRDRLSSGATVDIRVTQDSPHRIVVNVEARGLEPAGLQEVRAMVVRWLSIDWDPRQAIEVAHELDPDIATFIQNGGGRLLRCSSFFEDFVKTVCTIHAAWSATRRMTQRLVDTIGDGLFPRPTHILEAGEATLRGEARLGFPRAGAAGGHRGITGARADGRAWPWGRGPDHLRGADTAPRNRALCRQPHGHAAPRFQPNTGGLGCSPILPGALRHRQRRDRSAFREVGTIPGPGVQDRSNPGPSKGCGVLSRLKRRPDANPGGLGYLSQLQTSTALRARTLAQSTSLSSST